MKDNFKDEDVIKGLGCCAADDGDDCFQCPYGNIVYKPGHGGCVNRCRKDALDLINRQKAEIERLTDLSDQLGNDVDIKLNYIYDLEEKIETAKSESIKEFAERLKERLNTLEYTRETDRKTVPTDYFVHMMNDILHETVPCVIDSVLKEMTEESE